MTGSTPMQKAESLVQRLQRSFATHADLPALEGCTTLLTYRELERQSAALAHALVQAGVRSGHIVPLMMRRSPALVVAQLALLRLGAAYAPIDLTSPPARQQAMLAALQPSLIVSDGSAVVETPAAVLDVADVRPLADASFAPWHVQAPQTMACVMFTSGTTGSPKAVMVPCSGVTRLVCEADYADLRAGARWGFLSSPAFDAATLEVWAPLLNGACCVAREQALPSLDELADFLLSSRITDTWITAALFNALVEDRLDAFANLRQLLTGGERVSPRHARSVLEAFPGLRLINGYGPTENTTFTLCHTIAWADTDSPAGIPIGRPIRGTVVRVGTASDDADDGELLAGGEGVALGYLNDSELTQRKFVELDGRRWYRTGDLVHRRADGVFEFRGRVDRQVKIQGHRIELEEVEVLLGACPGVGDAAVLVRGDTAESRHLVACFCGSGGPPPSADSVAAFLRERLPPRAVPNRLVVLERMPLNMNGKLDRGALGLLVDQQDVPAAHDTGWHTETERMLAAIWQRCLPSATVLRQSSFIALGGTSLLAIQVSGRVRRQIGRDLSPIDVLRVPMLAEQARRIDAAALCETSESSAGFALEDQLPLTLAQQSMLLASQLDASGCAYLVHVALHLDGSPERGALRRAFETLAARHPALRMAVRVDANPTHARVGDALADGWWCEHAPLAQAPADLVWPEALLKTVNRPLDLQGSGVMRVDLWPVRDGSCLVVWTVHHVAIDDASIERGLLELDQLLAGKELLPVYGSPLGFATLEKAWTDHDAAYAWSHALVDALAGQPVPLERAPSPGREAVVSMPPPLAARLRAACAGWDITPFAPLLTAYGLALQDVFGPACRFASTPFSRRIEPELIEPVGYLLDLCLVEAGARSGETQAQTLARVNQAVLDLQRAAFMPRKALLEAIAKRDAVVAQHLNAFVFTWRLDPARSVPFGAQRARLLRAPQLGARFGLSLHTASVDGELHCSVEAVESAFARGQVEAVGRAFVTRLGELCEIAALPLRDAATAEPRPPRQAVSAVLESALRAAWERWVRVPAGSIDAASDFLHSGGNSLTVMRMAAQLRRDHGLSVDAGAFLGRPTFDNLCALAGEPPLRGPTGCIIVGRPDAPNLLLLIPGKGGQALGLYTLAEHLQNRLGADHAMVIVDLEAMLMRAPAQQPLWFLYERMGQLVKELGPQRIVGLVGFSLGGLLALRLARSYPLEQGPPPVWLLDSYAPRTMVRSLQRRIERRLAHGLIRLAADAAARQRHALEDAAGEPPGEPSLTAPLWEQVQERLGLESADAPGVEVHLVQARYSVHHVGLLWRRGSNGFNPRRYGHWHLHQIDAMHLELPRALAAQTADLFRSGLRWNPRAMPAR